MFKLKNEDYERAISLDELVKAARECSRNVKWKKSVFMWMHDVYENCLTIRNEILDGSYRLRKYYHFHLDDPKPRDICATRFRDRVIQRSLCNNGLYKALTNPLIYDNVACQKNKGTNMAIDRMKFHLRDYVKRNATNEGYYLKIDMKNYFGSMPHDSLKQIVSYYVNEDSFRRHVFEIIDSFEDDRPKCEIASDEYGKRGIGLGSQLSQLMALLYLNDLDHYIKEQLKVRNYIRYMDDMVLLVENRERANDIMERIRTFVGRKGLELNHKSRMGRIQDGIVFLKIRFKINENGRLKTRVIQKTLNRELRRLGKLHELHVIGGNEVDEKYLIQHCNTWYGFAKWRCSGRQLKSIKRKIREMFSTKT